MITETLHTGDQVKTKNKNGYVLIYSHDDNGSCLFFGDSETPFLNGWGLWEGFIPFGIEYVYENFFKL